MVRVQQHGRRAGRAGQVADTAGAPPSREDLDARRPAPRSSAATASALASTCAWSNAATRDAGDPHQRLEVGAHAGHLAGDRVAQGLAGGSASRGVVGMAGTLATGRRDRRPARVPRPPPTGARRPGRVAFDAASDDEGGGESTGTVLVALAANGGIAVAKGVAAVVSGSASMAAETAHSVVDTANELLLLTALRRSARPADRHRPSATAPSGTSGRSWPPCRSSCPAPCSPRSRGSAHCSRQQYVIGSREHTT